MRAPLASTFSGLLLFIPSCALALLSGCAETLPRSGLQCPLSAEVKTANDGDSGSREWCEIPSGKKNCSYYSGNCEVPGTGHGPWLHYDAAGHLDEMSDVDHGSISGTRMYWWPSGGAQQVSHWVNSKHVGVDVRWHESGSIAWYGEYADDRREGAWAGWFDGGKPAWSGTYKSGVPVGDWAFWNPDGSVARVDHFEHELEPAQVEACPQGAVASGSPESHYVSCTLERPSGAVVHGMTATWDANGRITDQSHWWLGERHGRHMTWNYYSGAPTQLETYVSGKPAGTWLTFDDVGLLAHADTYSDGVIVSTWQRPS
jgi:antitoxin component YwqK of YwqJK toxin-antitoxin module